MLFSKVTIPHFRATETEKETVTSWAVIIHPALSQGAFLQRNTMTRILAWTDVIGNKVLKG